MYFVLLLWRSLQRCKCFLLKIPTLMEQSSNPSTPALNFKFKRLCKQVFALLKCPSAMNPCQLCGCCCGVALLPLEMGTFLHNYCHSRTRRRSRGNGRAFSGAHSQAALPVLLPDLLWDSQLPGETLRGGAAAAGGGTCPAPGRARDSKE